MKKEEQKKPLISGKMARILLTVLAVILLVSAWYVMSAARKTTAEHLAENYHNKILITYEYTRRVISDVYVSVINNLYDIENNLNNPDNHKGVMERIVRNGNRVQSCGVSFIPDYYYPKKGHRFCPFAWRNPKNREEILTEEKGDNDMDYPNDSWFKDVIEGDSAMWAEPFYDGYDRTTTLTAYMVPVHDAKGKPVAVLGADISLDWLTEKMIETDSTINSKTKFAADYLKLSSQSFIVNHDGTFITHPDAKHILNHNFFSHVKPCDGSFVERLMEKIRAGIMSDKESEVKYLYDGQESYLFYTPVKYTEWIIVTVVPCEAIRLWGLVNGLVLLGLMVLSLFGGVLLFYGVKWF